MQLRPVAVHRTRTPDSRGVWPSSVHAAVLHAFGEPHEITEVTLRDPGPREVLIAV